MKTKFLYVVSSDDSDIYLEQVWLSAYSLRLQMPKGKAWVTLLIDGKTNESLNGQRSSFLSLIDEKIVVDFPEGTSKFDCSRLLKTGARQYVKGDFLYIDSDTIIVEPLYEVDDFDMKLGAVMNCHVPFTINPFREWHERQARQLGWSVEGETIYYNGGFFLARDVPESYEFFERWRKNWLYSKSKGIPNDEPSFNQSDIEMKHIMKEIPGEWNCQLKYGHNHFEHVKVIHFLCTQYVSSGVGCAYYFMDKQVYKNIKKDGLTGDIVEKLKDPKHCFNDLTMLVGGNELTLLHSPNYERMLYVYLNKGWTFRLLELLTTVCYRLRQISNLIKYHHK